MAHVMCPFPLMKIKIDAEFVGVMLHMFSLRTAFSSLGAAADNRSDVEREYVSGCIGIESPRFRPEQPETRTVNINVANIKRFIIYLF